MSSIRDALRRAERERMARQQSDPHEPDPPARGPERPPRAPEEPVAVETPAAPHELRLVESPPARIVEVPVDFTQELALFRQGVESAVPKPRRALVMTSAVSGEGVTTLSIYLAISLAVRDNKKTVLIDANFKSPKSTRVFGLLGRPGLSDYCTGRAELQDVLARTDSPSLYVMGLGTDIYNPSLVLSHERARGLATELTQRFDYVLFDAGAVLGNAETSMLAGTTDGVVLVVRAHKTKREVLGKAEKLIRFSGGAVIGTVLNRRKFPIPDSIYKRL